MGKQPDYTKYAGWTRGQMIRTIEHLGERQTELLNRIAAYERATAMDRLARAGEPLSLPTNEELARAALKPAATPVAPDWKQDQSDTSRLPHEDVADVFAVRDKMPWEE